MEVPICIFVLILGCLNSSYAQTEFRLSELFATDGKKPDTRTVVHIPQPSVNKGMTRTKSESGNPQTEGYILVPQVVKVPKRGSKKQSTSKRQRPSNVKRITSIDLLSDLNLNPSKDRLFNLTRSPPRDRFTDYTGRDADNKANSPRNRLSDLSRSSSRDVITELNKLSSRDRESKSRTILPVISTDSRVSSSQIETISQILNVPRSKVLAKLPQISRIFSQAAKIPSRGKNDLSKVPRLTPNRSKEPQSVSKIQPAPRKYPLVQQQSPQQQNLQQKPQQQQPQQQQPQQQQMAKLQIKQQEVPRLQLQQPDIPKPVTQQTMPVFTTNPKIFNSPQTPDMASPPMMKAFTDGSERGMNPGQIADPMNPIPGPMDPASMQQMSPDMPPYPPMSQPSLMQQMTKTFSDGSQISSGSQTPVVGPPMTPDLMQPMPPDLTAMQPMPPDLTAMQPMPPDLTAMQPMPQMGPDMPPYSAMGQAAVPQLMPGNQMGDMSFMPPPDMQPMPHGFQDPAMGMDQFGGNVDPACALGQVYATCTMNRIEEIKVYGSVDFSQQVDPMCTPIGNLMVNVKLFGFNPENMMFEHGLHVHEYGDMRGHCSSAGRIFNPYQMAHGGRQSAVRRLGDFGNVREDAEGNIFQTFEIPNTSIIGPLTIVGKALVIKSGPDSLGAGGMPLGAPGGGSGYPAGCCVIGKSDETRSAHIYNQMPVGHINMVIS